MTHRGSHPAMSLLGLLLSALSVNVALADLPTVKPPAESGDPLEQPSRTPEEEMTLLIMQQMREARQPAVEKPRAVDLQTLMKEVSDTKRPVNVRWADRLKAESPFAKLSAEQQSQAAPELLSLLENRTPLAYALVLPDRPLLELRDRALAALTQSAGVYYGQFPPADKKRSAEEAAADAKKAAELATQWKAWWAVAKDLDPDERREVTSLERRRLLDSDDLEVVDQNLSFVAERADVSAIEDLLALMDRQDLDQATRRTRVLRTAANLSLRPEAGAENRLALFNYLKKLNVPDASTDTQAIMVCAQALQQALKKPIQVEVVTVLDDEDVEVKLRLIKKECLDEWSKVIDGQMEKEKQANDEASEDAAAGQDEAE